MALDVLHWNGSFLDFHRTTGQAENLAKDYGITIEPVEGLRQDEEYWACIGVKHLTGVENMGNHNIFCDVLDERGDRIDRARLRMWQGNQDPVMAVVDKPAWEAGTNFPVWGATPCDVEVAETAGVSRSERVKGFRINHPDEERGNTIGHHSFYVVWKLVNARNVVPVPKPPPVQPPPPPQGPDHEPGDIIGTENLTFTINDRYQVDLVIVLRYLGE